jgi:protein arginine kinase activator
MFCEKCKKNEATIHLSEVIKDMKSEVHLCEQCARDVGLNTKITNFSLTLPEMLTFLNADEAAEYSDSRHCTACGSDLIAYKREGRLGCPECYSSLAEFLEPVLSGFHGEKRYIGKSPLYNDETTDYGRIVTRERKAAESVSDLQEQLDLAVAEERYEEAAVLRDKIREINLSEKKND